MAGTYKLVELVGTSDSSFFEAAKAAVAEASKMLGHLEWFEVVRETGKIVDGQVREFQVTLMVGSRITATTNALKG
jgi:dodecin